MGCLIRDIQQEALLIHEERRVANRKIFELNKKFEEYKNLHDPPKNFVVSIITCVLMTLLVIDTPNFKESPIIRK